MSDSHPVIPLRPDLDRHDSEPVGEAPGGRPNLRIRKLRVLGLILGLGLLAAVSTVFGMMMAIASDLPSVKAPVVRSSVLLDRKGVRIGLLTGSENRFYAKSDEIPPVMRHAVIAVEDKRYYDHEGVDLRGIARALYQDVIQQRVVQGGSTITQQFVKNALAAQNQRTLFNKLRESALAFHLTRNGEWTKEDVLRAYLNTIYFGNGAYGVEAAARVYFGSQHSCDADSAKPHCATQLEVHEAALLAGIIASPSGYDPIANPAAAKRRRDLVLQRMNEQGFINRLQLDIARDESLPTEFDLTRPAENTRFPYFTSWVKQQVVEELGGGQEGARLAFDGGLHVKTTLDRELQEAAQKVVGQWLPRQPGFPSVSMVVLDNRNAEVRAMIANGGAEDKDAYAERAFNLATQGQRQPGSAFKPFVLAEALKAGYAPGSTWSSRKKEFCVVKTKKRCKEAFQVNNYEDAYAGATTLARATTFSDNAVYAEVGIKVGTPKIAKLARRMGIRTPVSDNYAMTLGGLEQGVTTLDMAHAYNTFARGGKLTYGTLSPGDFSREVSKPVPGPVGLLRIDQCGDTTCSADKRETLASNQRREKQVLDAGIAGQVQSILASVVKQGTARRADLGKEMAVGKTGTTENYGDAWFVGWTKAYTVAVWVGYPDTLTPMKPPTFSFRGTGEPVAGGTYPAAIWKAFMEEALRIEEARRISRLDPEDLIDEAATPGAVAPVGSPAATASPAAPAPETGEQPQREPAPQTEREAPARQEPEPETEPPPPEPEDPPAADPEAGGAQPPPGSPG